MEIEFSLSEINVAAQCVLTHFPTTRIFLFEAEMGTGKTTFIKALAASLHAQDPMSSPSFSIVNEYSTKSGAKIFHFDLYRVKSVEELFDLGIEDYLFQNAYVFVEWPSLVLPFLDENFVVVKMEILPNDKRRLWTEVSGHRV